MIGIADSQNFTDIAEAIRKKLENFGGGTMRPSEMAAAIESIDTKDDMKKWTVNVVSRITEQNTIILSDEWLKEHRSDENLAVCLLSKKYVGTNDAKTVVIAIFSNTLLFPTTFASPLYYGMAMTADDSNSRVITNGSYERTLYQTGGGGGKIFIKDTGTLHLILSTTTGLNPGEYSIIAWLM